MGCIATKLRSFDEVYRVGCQVGEGSFGKVFVGFHKNTKQAVAIKVVERKGMTTEDEADLRAEVAILQSLTHHHIIRVLDFFEETERFVLVLEICDGGDLRDELECKERFDETEARKLCRNILKAISHLHENNIAHRDIKPQNILFTKTHRACCVKLGDFGLAEKADQPFTTFCGTPAYMAPEILRGLPYGVEVDCWAFGVMMYFILSGYLPFEGRRTADLFENIKEGEYSMHGGHWDEISEDAKNMISSLLHPNPVKRLTASEALQHPWIVGDEGLPHKEDLPTMEHRHTWMPTMSRLKSRMSSMKALSSLHHKHRTETKSTLALSMNDSWILDVSDHTTPASSTDNKAVLMPCEEEELKRDPIPLTLECKDTNQDSLPYQGPLITRFPSSNIMRHAMEKLELEPHVLRRDFTWECSL